MSAGKTTLSQDRVAAIIVTTAAVAFISIVIAIQPDNRSAGEKWRDACIQNAGTQGMVGELRCGWSQVPKSLLVTDQIAPPQPKATPVQPRPVSWMDECVLGAVAQGPLPVSPGALWRIRDYCAAQSIWREK